MSKKFHRLAYDEKDNFLKFIHKLGENGLKRLFKFPGEDFSLWWFSLVAEKSPLKSDAYSLLIDTLISKKHGYVRKGARRRIAELLLCRFLRGLYESTRFLFRILYIKTGMGDFKKRAEDLSARRYHIVSYFPLVNKEAKKEWKFENGYLGPFHRVMEKRLKDDYSHILMQVFVDGCDLKDAVYMARKFNRRQSLFFLEEFFKPSHIFAFLFYYLYFSTVFCLNLRRIKKTLLYKYEGKDYDVWKIFRDDLYVSFCGHNLASSIWYILLFREFTGRLDTQSKVLCIWEMQWWEKALYIYAAKRGITTVGVQHTAAAEMLLNHFNFHEEMKGKDFVEKCPMPDYLAAVGNVPAERFIKYGWPRERVFVWGAQRFESLKGADNRIVPWHDRENYFACALSINAIYARKTLLLFERAFKDTVSYKIRLKGHPTMDLKKMIDRAGIKLNPAVFELTNEPIMDITRRAKGLIVTESSSSFFGVASSTPLIVTRFSDTVDSNPFSYISDIPSHVYSAGDLRLLCDRIISMGESPVSSDICRDFLKNYLYFPPDENDYLEKITGLKTARHYSEG